MAFPENPVTPPVEGGNERILVVDDDPLVGEYLVLQLRGLGYQVTLAASGRDAIEVVTEQPTLDMLLTDVIMPGELTSRQMVEAVRDLQPNLKVLFCSGYLEVILIERGQLEQGRAFLKKPFRRAELARKVRAVLDGAS